MPNQIITSLHSPQVERVKALLHSRGKKIRKETGEFVVDSYQAIAAAMKNTDKKFPLIVALYLTEVGKLKLANESIAIPENLEVYEVSPELMNLMSEVESSQGLLAICTHQTTPLEVLLSKGERIAFFWQLQDPGNAGTVIRSADACGFSSVIFSNESVDLYSPKVVRSTVGSLWNIPVHPNIDIKELIDGANAKGFEIIALDAKGATDISDIPKNEKILLIFGNEARGLPNLPPRIKIAAIPMKGAAESFNVASAATIAMYEVGLRKP